MLEDTGNRTRYTPSGLNSGRNNIGRKLGNSIIQGLKDTERSIMPEISRIGQRAKTMANNALKHDSYTGTSYRNGTNRLSSQISSLTPTERALWIWSNVSNLDLFLRDVYVYYIGNGLTCIILKKVCDLAVITFIVYVFLFMDNCIDYSKLLTATNISDIRYDQCYARIGLGQKLMCLALLIILSLKIRNEYKAIRDLHEIKLFYNYLLGVSDTDLQTIGWPEIIKRIMILRDQNTNAIFSGGDTLVDSTIDQEDMRSKKKLNAHDVANRLMREENYMIALFNRKILSQPLKLPFFNTYFLTKTMEWNLKLCIFDFLFDSEGQLKKAVLSEQNRLRLSQKLSRRFQMAATFSFVITPFLVLYFLVYYFLRFFYEFRSDPNTMSTREFSPYANWKLREFNELPHIFDNRLKLAVKGSNAYLNQFPKERTDIILRFVSFISGSIVAILGILTVFGTENFLNFELFFGRTVLFYMSAFGALFTICKSSLSDTNTVFDPEASLRYVAQFTHYLPRSWEGRYHTESVRSEFCKLFNLNIVLVLKELASMILLPYFLYMKLPYASERIIDFFREYTIHVKGLGYVCSFATFNFENEKDRPKNMFVGKSGQWDTRDRKQNYYTSEDNKMVKSYLYFLESYGNQGRNPINQKRMRNKKPINQANDGLEHTVARLSPKSSTYVQNISNSMLLGKSFESTDREGANADTSGGALGVLNRYAKGHIRKASK